MSWFLKDITCMTKSKKKKIQKLGLLALLLFVCLWCFLGLAWAITLEFLGMLFLVLNLYAKKKIAWNADHLFTDIGRNYDYLLIGEPWHHESLKGKKICFFSPRRSLLSSYELGRRLFSLLKEDTGTLIISCRESMIGTDKMSVLDIPYLHEMQLHKYGITHKKLKTYLPFVFAPFETLCYFLSVERKPDVELSLSDFEEIVEFCKLRKINLKIIKIK